MKKESNEEDSDEKNLNITKNYLTIEKIVI